MAYERNFAVEFLIAEYVRAGLDRDEAGGWIEDYQRQRAQEEDLVGGVR
jgi:hypothetical protein